jgi:hypothetical protein
MFFGFVILVVGLVFLLKNLDILSGDVWPIIWPCLIIALGLSVLWKRKKRSDKWEKFGEGMRRFGEEMRKSFGDEKEK